ncbi:MAG: SusC/RagA family TonB-linked outer membrane protein [Bacteroidetes bacterium]|nr:SusC/RagA family TonB-linked outer membrane protein [Bacteroidota bacterium]
MKSLLLVFCSVLCMVTATFAQTRQVSGKVTGPDNKAVAAATVKIKGSTTATSTSTDGSFSIKVPAGNVVLEISSLGFATKEVSVGAAQSSVSVSLATQSSDLSDVVVTALGVKREKKALTYASQQVSGDELRKGANFNFMDALSGKAAGIDIKISSSGAGGSTKAVLRGAKSLIGTSEALYVIDGVPMVNNKGGQPGSYGGTDGGDGLSSINPADIESVNVLRGANASILYGSQGANGVIVITTKKGKAGKTTVDFNHSTIIDQVSGIPDLQFSYGAINGSDYNWSKTKSNYYQNNYVKEFFQTGVNVTNSVSVSGGNDKTTAFFSYANMSVKGVMPTNTYTKHNITLNQSTKLFNDKLTVSSNVIFAYEESKNRPGAGYYNNPLTGLYLFARERDFNSYKTNYQVFNPDRNIYKMNWYSTEEKQNNPYWEINNNSKLQTSSRVIANVKLSYDIAKHVKFETRANIDYNDVLRDNRYAAGGNSVSVSPNGTWSYTKYNDQALYADGIFTYNNTFGSYSVSALAGASYQKNTFNNGMSVGNGTVALMYPNFFTFANMPYNVIFNQTINRTIKQGAFANVQLGYKDMFYVDLSARNDWASTLALTGNQSYLYPAVGLSGIVSQMVKLPEVISYMKVRASYSQTGNEVPFNVVNPWNSINGSGGPTGIGGIARNTQVPFTNLKPEIIEGNEYGLEMKLFKNKIGVDFTYYKDISTNQFLSLAAPSGSGFTSYYVNAGRIENKGFELTVDAQVINGNSFKWKTAVNVSQNKNLIAELIASNPNYQVGGDDEGFASVIRAGGSFNDLWIYKFARNTAGQIILNATSGVPTKAATQEKVGNVNPDFLLGFNNSFTYNNWYATVLVQGKFGGVAFSKTEAFLDSYGVSQRTADARDKGMMPINAIQGTTAVTSIDPAIYYSAVGDRNKIMEPYLFSRTNVRLGQLVLGYNLKSKNPNSIIKDANFSLVGRNLFFFYKDAPFDPEQSMSTGNGMQSNDVFGLPSTRSFGVNVKFTF